MTVENDQIEGTDLESQPLEGSTESTQTDVESQPEEIKTEWTQDRENEFNQKVLDGYEPTDEELSSYEEWVKGGKATPEPDDSEKEVTDLEAKESNADSGDSNSDPSKPQSEEEIKSLTDAMSKVGAKTVDELPGKISGLLSQLGKQGGEMGTQLKEAQSQAQNISNLLQDLGEGKQSAIDFMQKTYPDFGKNFGKAPVQSDPVQPAPGEFNADNFLDPELAAYVKGLESKVTELQGHQENARTAASQRIAIEQSVNEISQFVKNHPEYWTAAANVGDMTRAYYNQNPSDPVDPRMTEIHKLLDYAQQNKLQTLEDAHLLMNRDSFSQQLADAERRGREQALRHAPNNSAASKRNQRSETNYTPVSEADIEAIANGNKPIPESWFNENDTWNWDAIPQAAHKYIGGKLPS